MHRASFEQSPFAQMILQNDGMIVQCNHQASLQLGTSERNLRYSMLFDHVKQLSAQQLTQHFHQAQRQQLANLTLHLDHSPQHPTQALCYPIQHLDQQHFLLTFLPQAAQDAQKPQPLPKESVSDSKAYKAFVRKLTHDFNNMLSIISTYAQLLDEDIPDASTWQQDIQEIAQAAGRAKKMVHHLSTVSRSDLDNRKVADLHDMLKKFIKPYFNGSDHPFEFQCTMGAKTPFVYVHHMQFQQMLSHLVQNAKEALSETTTSPQIQVISFDHDLQPSDAPRWPGTKPGRYIGIQVRDNGHGMSPEVLKQACAPLFTTRTKDQHAGLGLSTAQEILRQHDGALHVESSPDEGTCITILLPRVLESHRTLAANSPRGSQNPRESLYTGDGERILVIEPYKPIANLMKRILEQKQWTPLIAANGSEAIELARSSAQPIDLLVTNLVLPDMSASELIAQLSTLNPNTPLPVLTIADHDTTLQDDKTQGALTKPFTPHELSLATWQALNQAT